jgi:aspartate aminotransferase
MFADAKLLPPDPILGLSKAFAEDPRAEKVDLGIGVYRTPDGRTPIMQAVAKAEALVMAGETTKAYTPADGAPGFNDAIMGLLFGEVSAVLREGRCAAMQTPGGCGALRTAGELLARLGAAGVTIGEPTWPNHKPLLSAAGLPVRSVPYYDATASAVAFDAFLAAAEKLGPKDVLLLHGACHNPTGADLTREQIDAVIDVALDRGFLPLIDCAYHGFAVDLDTDAYIIREFARRLPEVLITYSCSKNFGLYRERTGAIIFVGANAERAAAIKSHAINVARSNYSMPPAHGGAIVAEILRSPELTKLWRDELTEMSAAVRSNRRLLVKTARDMGLSNRLSFIESQNGMFSLLPMTVEEVQAARERHGVYIVGAGRINLCGVNAGNVEAIVSAYKDVTGA